jgi:FAD/FMN-containing dehydrogenase
MSKIAHYLQEHLVGEVMTGIDARRYFATDASIFQLAPSLVVYPRNENDVRKTARFTWQLAERGRIIPITPRGSGTDQTGAALGSGIMLVFPAHMNRILELDTKLNTVVIEPGINYGKLQQTLHTHGRFLPPFPASIEYSTVGGAIANNSSGDKSVKYGDTRKYVKSLRVVLANGEVIHTTRLTKRELSKKLGLATFEGEIYRSIDTLLEDNTDLIKDTQLNVTKNNAGYNLANVKHKDGSFDLTPLIVGSQGTLGIVTEAELHTAMHNPQTSLIFASFDNLQQACGAVRALRSLSDSPSSIELIDGKLLEQVYEMNPYYIKGVIDAPFPAAMLFIELDNVDRHIKKYLKQTEKILHAHASKVQVTSNPEKQQVFWKVRELSSALLTHNEGLARSLPIVDGGAVPLDQLEAYVEGIYELFKNNNLKMGVWGHIGDANLHAQPKLNLAHVGDRQKAFRMIEDWHKMVINLGGTFSSESGDGRLHTPYLGALYAPEVLELFRKVKTVFDPYGTLNPGVKFNTTIDDMKDMIRSEYGLDHIFDHLPRS